MIKIVVAMALLAGASMAQFRDGPRFRPRYDEIVNYRTVNDHDGAGNYNYLWENSDGTTAQERGYQKPPNPGSDSKNNIQVAEGSYQYYSPEGQLIKVSYIADENGFQPTGDHLPTPPPIPPAIQKALDIIYAGIAKRKSEQELQRLNYEHRFKTGKK